MMQPYTLPRTGAPPLAFNGEKLAEASSRIADENPKSQVNLNLRWHEARIYRTAGGKTVLEIVYRTDWPGETNHHHAEAVEDIPTCLRKYDPIGNVRGFPPTPNFAARQARLLADLRRGYERMIAELLGQLPQAAEVIE